MLKYRNIKTEIDGIKFHSKKEAKRYSELKMLESASAINQLELQPQFPLYVNGEKICKYIADFRYFDVATQTWVVEDVKSPASKTPVYRLKKKILANQLQPVYITEV